MKKACLERVSAETTDLTGTRTQTLAVRGRALAEENVVQNTQRGRYARKGTGDTPSEVSLSRCKLVFISFYGKVSSTVARAFNRRGEQYSEDPVMEREEDRRRFEKTREVREVQTRNISEEASEEDRRQ